MPPQHSAAEVHDTPSCLQVVVEDVVDVDVLVLVLVLVEDDEVVGAVVAVVEVVPLVQAALRAKVEADGHEPLHAWPAAQHVRFTPLPHGVLPAGQPQNPLALSMQGTPELQHEVPHGVVPEGQQQDVAVSEQAAPLPQHPWPHVAVPAGQVTAPPRKGRRRMAPAAAAAPAPSTFSAPRREVGWAKARERLSNRSVMASPCLRCALLTTCSVTSSCRHRHCAPAPLLGYSSAPSSKATTRRSPARVEATENHRRPPRTVQFTI
jgi:hypothetical protein